MTLLLDTGKLYREIDWRIIAIISRVTKQEKSYVILFIFLFDQFLTVVFLNARFVLLMFFVEGLEGYSQDPGSDRNMVQESGKW